MATPQETTAFIQQLAPLATKEAIRRKAAGLNWSLPSVCIAQAALETGWGTSPLMTKAKAYFGIKWSAGYKAYSTLTREVYDGKTTYITAAFRAYDTVEESVKDYFQLICDSGIYKKAVCKTTPKETIEAIKKACYATDPNYVTSVMSIVNDYDLAKYDAVVTMPDIEYNAWIKTHKWLGIVRNGATIGRAGYALRCVKIRNIKDVGRVQYRVHMMETNQWSSWKIGAGIGVWAGSTKCRIDAIQIRLLDNNTYSIHYRTKDAYMGKTSGWKQNGETAGELGFPIERLEIELIKK